jgi:hypothetical protein
MPVIGFLNSASADGYTVMADAFKQGLKETGYIEGQNVAVEYRWANNAYDRLPGLAADLVKRQVAVIVANSPSIAPAMAATTTIPILTLAPSINQRRFGHLVWIICQSGFCLCLSGDRDGRGMVPSSFPPRKTSRKCACTQPPATDGTSLAVNGWLEGSSSHLSSPWRMPTLAASTR